MHILSKILLLHMGMHTDCRTRTQSCPGEIWKGERAQNLEDQAPPATLTDLRISTCGMGGQKSNATFGYFWLKLGTWAKKYQKGGHDIKNSR